jgi:hypothetical protein
MPGAMVFFTNPSSNSLVERMRIDSTGRVAINSTIIPIVAGLVSQNQIAVNASLTFNTTYIGYGDNSSPQQLIYVKTGSGSFNGNTILAANGGINWFRYYGNDGSQYQETAILKVDLDGAPAAGSMPGKFSFWTSPTGTGTAVERLRVDATGKVLALTATGGMGYGPAGGGTGGAVTQLTNKATGVTLNNVCGQITMNAAALAASTTVSFTLTNSAIAATDLLVLNHVSGGTAGAYTLNSQCAGGSASINVRNVSLAALSEAIVIGFALQKAVIN